jgi:hypothetical protein
MGTDSFYFCHILDITDAILLKIVACVSWNMQGQDLDAIISFLELYSFISYVNISYRIFASVFPGYCEARGTCCYSSCLVKPIYFQMSTQNLPTINDSALCTLFHFWILIHPLIIRAPIVFFSDVILQDLNLIYFVLWSSVPTHKRARVSISDQLVNNLYGNNHFFREPREK